MLDRLPTAWLRVGRAHLAGLALAVLGTGGYALSRAPSFLTAESAAFTLHASQEATDAQPLSTTLSDVAAGTDNIAQEPRDAEKLAAHFRALAGHIDTDLFGGAFYKTVVHGTVREMSSNDCAQSANANNNFD